MGKIIVFIVIGVLIAGVVARSALRKRREKATTELNKHPERLEQSLDPTDDA
jgi:hypothetical protein